MRFPLYKQANAMDCGAACLRMVAKYYGKYYNAETLRQIMGFSKEGVSMLGISEAAEKIGFRTRGVQLTFDQVCGGVQLPCILHWDQSHFVVLLRTGKRLSVADPARGVSNFTKREFLKYWASQRDEGGIQLGTALLLEITPSFFENENDKENKLSWGILQGYLRQSKWQLLQVLFALLITSLLQLIFPFLTQSIVDTGISTHNLQYISIVLIGQLMLIFSKSIVDFIRNRLLLHVSTIVNLSILSDFWIKLTRLPLSYFDSYHTGDILQRINDNRQIQNFLTGSATEIIFSVFNFLIFALVLASYNVQLFFIFAVGTLIYFAWILIFLRVRRKINYQNFKISSRENGATLEMVQGMQEIRLHNAERLKRWEWENIQAGIFKLTFKSLTYSQVQQAGALLLNQGKDILITFLVAGLVIQGKLSLGAMLAIQYILGQLTGPVEQFVGFIQGAQDAKISMDRLNEIHQMKDEEDVEMNYVKQLPEDKSIYLNNFSFSYPGAGNENVLEIVSLKIPHGKVTAVVGVSGSGKTTLLKLLLKFYTIYGGDIKIGETNFRFISPSYWRKQCGAVMQNGYIFDDSIARNIAVGEESVDQGKLVHSCKVANILTHIESLPNGFNTKLGSGGVGLSQGQKQRLLIARAVYRNPEYLFFDEATNSLDANNEKAIVENLLDYYIGRTVLIVAHRLSTVKHADNIIVLHQGKVVEQGTHQDLSATKGRYYELVKNQLQLGS